MKAGVLAARVVRGDRGALARAITAIENREEGARELLARAGTRAGGAFVVGITGPPGTGKSTLVDRLVAVYAKKGLRVGVIAVDPSSPITGGALLGDRVRMGDLATDEDVFIRSMAARGWSGGLSAAVADSIRMVEAWGAKMIFVETVGIGQADVEVMRIAHVVVVVLMPSMGDDVQVSKAGLMEVGDIYAVNKSDLEGAEQTAVHILSMARGSKKGKEVVRVSALKGDGLDRLTGVIDGFRARFAGKDGKAMKVKSIRGMMVEDARRRILARFEDKLDEERTSRLAEAVADGQLGFEEAVKRLAKSDSLGRD